MSSYPRRRTMQAPQSAPRLSCIAQNRRPSLSAAIPRHFGSRVQPAGNSGCGQVGRSHASAQQNPRARRCEHDGRWQDSRLVSGSHGVRTASPRQPFVLADPRRWDMRNILNQRIKHREDFRPFAPSVMAERAEEWFELGGHSTSHEFMLFACPVKPERRDRIPAIVHQDGTPGCTRRRESNPRFHELISCFFARTGVPVVINTSFNDSEPIVCTPADAIVTFRKTSIDALFMDDVCHGAKLRSLLLQRPTKAKASSNLASSWPPWWFYLWRRAPWPQTAPHCLLTDARQYGGPSLRLAVFCVSISAAPIAYQRGHPHVRSGSGEKDCCGGTGQRLMVIAALVVIGAAPADLPPASPWSKDPDRNIRHTMMICEGARLGFSLFCTRDRIRQRRHLKSRA